MTPAIVGETSRDAIISTLVMAFSSDPPSRWAYEKPAAYLEHFPKFASAFCGRAFAQGAVWQAGNGAAAVWLPPGVEPDEEALIHCIQSTAPPELQPDLFALFEQMGPAHPAEPHWYLPMIGVDPAMQGRGLGSALLEAALKVVDREGKIAYLEATSRRSVALYRRHGFEVTGRIQAGTSPEILPMVRAARAV